MHFDSPAVGLDYCTPWTKDCHDLLSFLPNRSLGQLSCFFDGTNAGAQIIGLDDHTSNINLEVSRSLSLPIFAS